MLGRRTLEPALSEAERVIREAHRNLFLKQRERVADFERLLTEVQCATTPKPVTSPA